MNITKDEYKLLKRFYTHKNVIINNETSEILIQKELIEPQSIKSQRNGLLLYSPELVITNAGKLAFEQYREERLNKRNISIRSWIAIVISLIALIVTILK